MVIVLLFRGPIVPGLVRCPSKVKDFRQVVCGHRGRARTAQRAELVVSLCRIRCALWAVLGSGNGPYKLYIEITEAAAVCQKVCDGRDDGLLCRGTVGCAKGIKRTQEGRGGKSGVQLLDILSAGMHAFLCGQSSPAFGQRPTRSELQI